MVEEGGSVKKTRRSKGGIRCNGRGVREYGEGGHGEKHNCGRQEVPRYGAERE
jgi:hypothetical protein